MEESDPLWQLVWRSGEQHKSPTPFFSPAALSPHDAVAAQIPDLQTSIRNVTRLEVATYH